MKANEFKKYWDKKSQKRRKSWEGKLKRRVSLYHEEPSGRVEGWQILFFGGRAS